LDSGFRIELQYMLSLPSRNVNLIENSLLSILINYAFDENTGKMQIQG
jgi:hypothetical protein